MKNIKNIIHILTLATLGLFAFGPPTQAAPNSVESAQFSCADVTEIPRIECEALVAIYNSETNRPTGWLESTTPCSWSGIICESDHIRGLYLYSNQLSSLPAEIGNLTNWQLFRSTAYQEPSS